MKHSLLVTSLLILTFLAAQLFGLFLIQKEAAVAVENATIAVTYGSTAIGERPITTGGDVLLYIVIGVAAGTLLLLVLMRYNRVGIWKVWFFLAVWLAMSVAIGSFIPGIIALLLSALLALWKLFKPNVLIHNLTEVLMYSGIALLFVPMFAGRQRIILSLPEPIFWVALLLLIISVYDMYAVWKSKHMVKMAKFQAKSNIFAGLYIPYSLKHAAHTSHSLIAKKTTHAAITSVKKKHALLGGGDIAFPLLFSGVVLVSLLQEGMTKQAAFLHASIIVLFATVALSLLFFFAEKDRFYPAMPFLTLGCYAGYVIMLLV